MTCVVSGILTASKLVGRALQCRTVVGGKDDDCIVQRTLGFEHIEQLTEVCVKLRHAVGVNARACATLIVVARIYRGVWPWRSVVCKELFFIVDFVFYPARNLTMYQSRSVALVEFFRTLHYLVTTVRLYRMIERRHIVDVVRTVEVIKALVGWQILTVVTKVPLAEATRSVACSLEGLRHSNFVAEHTVYVSAELNGIEYSSRSKRGKGVDCRIHNVVGVSSIRISTRHERKSCRRANAVRRIEVVKVSTVERNAIDVRRLECRSHSCLACIVAGIAVAEVVHKDNEHVRSVFFFVDVVKVFLFALAHIEYSRIRSKIGGKHEYHAHTYESHGYRASDSRLELAATSSLVHD